MLASISNVSINVYDEVCEHPVIALRDKGVSVTVNSDDPPFFRCDLVDNYTQLLDAFSLGVEDIVQFAHNSFTYSYATNEEKTAYLNQLDNWLMENSYTEKSIQ